MESPGAHRGFRFFSRLAEAYPHPAKDLPRPPPPAPLPPRYARDDVALQGLFLDLESKFLRVRRIGDNMAFCGPFRGFHVSILAFFGPVELQPLSARRVAEPGALLKGGGQAGQGPSPFAWHLLAAARLYEDLSCGGAILSQPLRPPSRPGGLRGGPGLAVRQEEGGKVREAIPDGAGSLLTTVLGGGHFLGGSRVLLAKSRVLPREKHGASAEEVGCFWRKARCFRGRSRVLLRKKHGAFGEKQGASAGEAGCFCGRSTVLLAKSRVLPREKQGASTEEAGCY
jgi:hypothetical protein